MAGFDLVNQFIALRDQLGTKLPSVDRPAALAPVRRPAAPAAAAPAGDLSPAERWIIMRESSGRTTAKNPKSSAFGLGQLIRANRIKYGRQFGFDPDTTDYGQQLQMFRQYVKDRYGTPDAAQQFWQRKGWY